MFNRGKRLVNEFRIAQVVGRKDFAVVFADPAHELIVKRWGPDDSLVHCCGLFVGQTDSQPQTCRATTVVHALSKIDITDFIDGRFGIEQLIQASFGFRRGLAISGTEHCHFPVGASQQLAVEQVAFHGFFQWKFARRKLDHMQRRIARLFKNLSKMLQFTWLVDECLFVDKQHVFIADGNNIVVKDSGVDGRRVLLYEEGA